MPEMATMLTVFALDRPALDCTGLEGAFDRVTVP